MTEYGADYYQSVALLRYLCDVKGLITQDDINAIDALAQKISEDANKGYEEYLNSTPAERRRSYLTVVEDGDSKS